MDKESTDGAYKIYLMLKLHKKKKNNNTMTLGHNAFLSDIIK